MTERIIEREGGESLPLHRIEDDSWRLRHGNFLRNLPDTSYIQSVDSESGLSKIIDIESRERSMTLDSFRDRAFTLGSELDLNFGIGIGDILSIDGNHMETTEHNTPPGTVISVTSFNTVQGTTRHLDSASSTALSSPPSSPLILPRTVSTAQGNLNAIPNTEFNKESSEVKSISSYVTTKQVNSDLDRSISRTVSVGRKASLTAHAQLPEIAASYETAHIGKRMRSGTISGRLRSMSDLEDKGFIDHHQKGILKDLIISGDDVLQSALDQYELGDTSQLEQMIKNGALNNKVNSDIDILGDIDLDFLTMHDDFGLYSTGGNGPYATKMAPVKRTTNSQSWSFPHSTNCAQQGFIDDGIGELEFNGHYVGGTEIDDCLKITPPGSSHTHTPALSSSFNTAQNSLSKAKLESAVDDQRFRSNSLAFGGLIDEPPSDDDQALIGKWMDRTLPIVTTIGDSSKPLKKRLPVTDIVQIESDSYFRVNNPVLDSQQDRRLSLSKSEAAAEKRREKEEQKILKERERVEKKALRDKEMREKKEKEAQDRKEKKELKVALAKVKQDEKKRIKSECNIQQEESDEDQAVTEEPSCRVIVSGTGRPRSLSDPNLSVRVDSYGLLNVDGPPDWVGAYSPESRKIRIDRFLAKRHHRVWVKKVKYDVRKNFADSRLRVKGRFVRKEDEVLMRDLMSLT